MKLTLVIACLYMILVNSSQGAEITSAVLIRYENETGQINLTPRKRVRLIASLGLSQQINENWTVIAQARTGSRNKQNVPAVTVYQISEHPKGQKDVYISRLYSKATFNNLDIYLGKIPWKTTQITDLFWDRDLNPIGVHLDYTTASGSKLSIASFKPLDGASNTIGHMSIVQYQTQFSTKLGLVTLTPWLVDYNGQSNATFATKDTELDNQFLRLSAAIKKGSWQLGMDLGRSVNNLSNEVSPEFAQQKTSYTFELKEGSLKNTGDYLTQFKYLYVERFAVVTEFAQNASSRFATSNFKGWDLRVRRKMASSWWLGVRLSDTKRLVGDKEESTRFRVETKYMF